MSSGSNLCECGCGRVVKPGNKYIHGHNRAGKASFTADGRWSVHYDRCVKCGTTEVPHQAHGLCANCWQKDRNRKMGRPERNFGGWSWYHDKCSKCGTVDKPHAARGLCADCLEETKRERAFGSDELSSCPICGVRARKLAQHISMRSRSCDQHLAFYNMKCEEAIDLFHSSVTARETGTIVGLSKKHVLSIWHENFSKQEIKERGERIRISKISGDKHYLFGTIPPTTRQNYVEFTDIKGRFYVMRSSWEVKYAAYLDKEGVDWEYEKYKFKYHDRDNIPHYYFPDFYLPSEDLFVEIKGYMTDKDQYKVDACVDVHGIDVKVLYRLDLERLGINI